MNHINTAVQRAVVDDATGFRVQIHAVGTIRESLHAVVQLAFFRVIHFVDKGIAKSAHLNGLNVAYVEIGVQGGRCFEFAVRFQFNLAGFTQLEAGIQGEFMWPQGARFIIRLELKGQHRAVFIFVVGFQRPLLVTGETVRR